MAADAYEYRVIRRLQDESLPDEATILAPTEDRRRAMSVYAIESMDGDGVELQARKIGPWEQVEMPSDRLRDTLFAPRDRPAVDASARFAELPEVRRGAILAEADRLAATGPSPSLGGQGAGDG